MGVLQYMRLGTAYGCGSSPLVQWFYRFKSPYPSMYPTQTKTKCVIKITENPVNRDETITEENDDIDGVLCKAATLHAACSLVSNDMQDLAGMFAATLEHAKTMKRAKGSRVFYHQLDFDLCEDVF